MKNVIGVIPGKNPALSGQSVVVGAHYDHLGLGRPDAREDNKGKVHPGADDNASGVALLIELAGELRKKMSPDRSIVFAAFTGEEAGKKGSQYYTAHQHQYPVEKCIGMVNLDTVGRLGKRKLLVLGAGSAREWVHIFRGASYVTGVETEMVSEKLDSGDQISFEAAGVPAVQLFTGPHPDYHRPTDTPDKIDGEGLEKVASVSTEVIEYLAGREEPLTETVKGGEKAVPSQKQERKVSLGTIPDFTFSGRGCRISGVMPDTPAEACGLREGDVIIRINSAVVSNLKEYSDILKSLSPGERITITILRDSKEMTVEAEVKAR
jgi:Zn-dependent M28 family amino/carboxypeptidase